ncbi:hypothetical protein [Sporocytophaga myxococcoides]|uniref:hypothetical protein n=1 Tax=Sporocytophaga myxococcoides TaxID=153721 RepID=UPI0004022EA6|nr:hypothetical protein [Sporocytophaga myxococcoides]
MKQTEQAMINAVDLDGVNEIIVHDLTFEEVSKGNYQYVDIPLFVVFKFKINDFKKDEV